MPTTSCGGIVSLAASDAVPGAAPLTPMIACAQRTCLSDPRRRQSSAARWTAGAGQMRETSSRAATANDLARGNLGDQLCEEYGSLSAAKVSNTGARIDPPRRGIHDDDVVPALIGGDVDAVDENVPKSPISLPALRTTMGTQARPRPSGNRKNCLDAASLPVSVVKVQHYPIDPTRHRSVWR